MLPVTSEYAACGRSKTRTLWTGTRYCRNSKQLYTSTSVALSLSAAA